MINKPADKLSFIEHGFVAHLPCGKREEVIWEQVREIIATRQDPDGADLMCLGFRVSNEPTYVYICEETPEYQTLLGKMCDALGEIDRNWWLAAAESYGTTTIYGISQSRQARSSPAEAYLARAGKRKPLTRRIRRRIIPTILALFLAAAVGNLASWLIADFSNVMAAGLFPVLLVVVVARLWPNPRLFFVLLIAYHLAELTLYLALGRPGPCLLGKLLDGQFQYILLLGVEILLGMGTMLLPDKHAAGPIR
jgi:hypothetical protein